MSNSIWASESNATSIFVRKCRNTHHAENKSSIISDAGAVTLGTSQVAKIGVIGASNSVLGTSANGSLSFAYDADRKQMVVGKGRSQGVSVFNYLILPGEINVRQPLGPDLADGASSLSFITTALHSTGVSKTLLIMRFS